MLNYGLRVGELLLPECVSVKIPGIIFLKSCSDFDDKHIHNEGDGFFITQEITALSLMVTTRMY